MRSGLVKLLDNLCSMSDLPQGSTPAPEGGGRGEDGDEEGEVIQRVTVLVWAAFQVLADRCILWEGTVFLGVARVLYHLVLCNRSRCC